MLLLHLHRVALRLRPVVPLCFLLGTGSAGLALLLIARGGSEQALALALGVSIWALLLFAFVKLFQSIPPPVLPHDTFLERLRTRCKLGLYHMLALGMGIVTVVLIALSLKLLSANT